jgi:hypothetical protein
LSEARPRKAGTEPEAETPSRAQRRDDAARAALIPLAPGERPPALLVAIAVAAALGLGNLIAYLAGAKIAGKHDPGWLSFSALTGLIAAGMWNRRYWGVVAFVALLTLIILVFSLFLVEASNIEAVVLCSAVLIGGGWLFWKLIRVMGRLAVPRD